MATRGDGLGERRRYGFGGAVIGSEKRRVSSLQAWSWSLSEVRLFRRAVGAGVKAAARASVDGRRTAMTIRCDGCVLRSIIAVSVAPHVLPGHGAYEEVLRFEVARRTRGLTP